MTTDAHEPVDGSETPGAYLARVIREQLGPLDRMNATRDVAPEMIPAGAEQDLTPGRPADERPEPFTDADHAAADPDAETRAAEPGADAADPGPARG